MTFEQFLSLVDATYTSNRPILRYGQTVMNVLYEARPDMHRDIVATDEDCFYDDSAVRFTLEKLERDWANES